MVALVLAKDNINKFKLPLERSAFLSITFLHNGLRHALLKK